MLVGRPRLPSLRCERCVTPEPARCAHARTRVRRARILARTDEADAGAGRRASFAGGTGVRRACRRGCWKMTTRNLLAAHRRCTPDLGIDEGWRGRTRNLQVGGVPRAYRRSCAVGGSAARCHDELTGRCALSCSVRQCAGAWTPRASCFDLSRLEPRPNIVPRKPPPCS